MNAPPINKKKVIDYYGAPKILKEFESLIDACIDYKRLKKIEKITEKG